MVGSDHWDCPPQVKDRVSFPRLMSSRSAGGESWGHLSRVGSGVPVLVSSEGAGQAQHSPQILTCMVPMTPMVTTGHGHHHRRNCYITSPMSLWSPWQHRPDQYGPSGSKVHGHQHGHRWLSTPGHLHIPWYAQKLGISTQTLVATGSWTWPMAATQA